MCGLVGVAGPLGVFDEAVFTALLIADSVRGTDSTGAAILSKSNAIQIVKALGNPFQLLDTKTFDREVNGLASQVFLGHNRFATLGKKTIVNAHPFQYGSITGAHNGTLESWSHSNLEDLVKESFDVDSQAIFAAIDRVGIDETAKVMEGAWALSWIDQKRKKLCFWKNDERPLWYAFYGDTPRLTWASKSGMIGFAADNAGQHIFKQEYYKFDDDTLYEWDLPLLSSAQKGEIIQPEKRKLAGKAGSWTSGYGCGTSRYSWEEDDFGTSTTGTHSGPFVPDKPSAPSKLTIYGSEGSPYGGVVSEEEMGAINECACSFCQAPIVYGDEGVVIDLVNDTLLCQDCSPSFDTTIYVSPVALGGLQAVFDKTELNVVPFAD